MPGLYDNWKARLRGDKLPVIEREPECGFWFKRTRGARVPVAIYLGDNDRIVALIGVKADSPQPIGADKVWIDCAANPITKETYREVYAGGAWPGDHTKAPANDQPAEETAPVAATSDLKPRPNAPAADPNDTIDNPALAAFRDQIDSAIAQAKAVKPPTTDEEAAAIQGLRARLLELHRKTDERRTELKAPHLKAGKDIDEAWQPPIKNAKAEADRLNSLNEAYETAKLRARREEERLAEQRRVAAIREQERVRIENEAAARAAEEAGRPAPEPKPEPVVTPAEPVAAAPVETKIAPTVGRAASKKAVYVAVISSVDKVFQVFKNDARVITLLQKLAQEVVDAGGGVDGVVLEEKVKLK